MSTRPTFDSGFSTGALTQVFSVESTVERILDFEAALALGLADAGIAPRDEAEELAAACDDAVDDPGSILATTWTSGTPILALGELVRTRVSPDAGKWFHHGATTQDAVDTGLALQCSQALASIDADLVAIGRRLRELTVTHRDQPQVGRTFLQHGKPTTFGLRTAGWLSATLDHIDDLVSRRRRLSVSLGGSNGTLSDYGDKAGEVIASVASRLGLTVSDVTWHADRDRVLSLAQSLQRMSRTMAKIATDVAFLASTEVAEVTVRSGGSASMPGKQNPIDSIRAIAAASACSGAVAMMTSAPPNEMDRGVGGWHVEWLALPLAFQTAGAAAESMSACLSSLAVDADAMGARAGQVDEAWVDAQIDSTLERAGSTLAR
jgi:3-carboxy-cis,cis-muconate cycloisomerase